MANYTALVDVKVNVARANKSFKDIEGSLTRVSKRTAQTNQFLQRMEASFGRIEKQLNTLNKVQVNSIRSMRSLSKGAIDAAKEIDGLKKKVSDLEKKLKSAQNQGWKFGNIFKSLNKVYKENAYLIQSITAGLFGFIQYNLIGGIRRMSDQFILMTSRLRVVNDNTAMLNKNLLQSYKIAQETRQPLFQVANTLARIGRNSAVLQKDFKKLGVITRTIGKSFQVAGATIEEANNAMIQLSQAFASGRLQGDELRSVLELAPRLAQGIAKQIGISVGSLRAFAKEGKLTTEVLRKAIEGAAKSVDRDFTKVQQTIGQAITNINSTFLMLVGTTERVTGTNRKFVDALEKINKGFQRLAGSEVLIYIGDALGYIANNLQMFLKVTLSIIGTGVLAAFLMALKAIAFSLGLFLIPLAAASAGMYYFLDSVIDTEHQSGTSFKNILKEAKGPLTKLEKEIINVENKIKDLKKELSESQESGSWKWMYDLLAVFQAIDDRVVSIFKKMKKGAGDFGESAWKAGTPESRKKDEQEVITKEILKNEKKLNKLEAERYRSRRENARRLAYETAAARKTAERLAEDAFLKSYRVELAAVKELNKEKLLGVNRELSFKRDPKNLYDVFGAQESDAQVDAAEKARRKFSKILGGFKEAPGQFGEIIKKGRVDKDALTSSLETDALKERFQKEPALRKALAKEAEKIASDLNTTLIEGERRRLLEQKNMHLRYLNTIKEATKMANVGGAMAESYGDPNRLRGDERASYEKMVGKVEAHKAGRSAMLQGQSSTQVEAVKNQTIELTKQQFALQRINQLNSVRTQAELAGYTVSEKEADVLLERSLITGKLTKEAQITKIANKEILDIAKKMNIPAEELKVTKEGSLDLDLESMKFTKEEMKMGAELVKLSKAKVEAKKAGMPTGEWGDAPSMNAMQSGITSGIKKAGGASAQRAAQTAQAYQMGGGGLTGAINAIFALVLSNKKVMEAISKIFDAIMEPIDAILDPLGELISAIMMIMKPFRIFFKLIGKTFGGIIKSLVQILHPFSKLFEALQPILVMLGAALQLIVQFISAIIGGIGSLIEDFFDWIMGPTDPDYKSETLLTEEANLLSSIEESLEGAANALKKINDVVFEITNSALNLLAPSVKLDDAQDKYDELFNLAKTIGSDEYIDEYTAFAKEYLQQSQDVLKSSAAYQTIYDKVLSDLNTLQGAEFKNTSENLTEELRGAAFNLDLVGSDLGEAIRKVVKNFQAGAIDFVDVIKYVSYKKGQVETDLELKQMAEFGSIDIEAEFERIRKARGGASSASSVAEDFAALGLELVITNPTHYAVGITRNSDGSISVGAIGEDDAALGMIAAAHANGIPVLHDPETARYLAAGGSPSNISGSFTGGSAVYSTESLIGDIGGKSSFSAKTDTNLFGGGIDLVKMFENIGKMIIDGLIAALKAIGATVDAILKAVFGFIQDALDGISDLGSKILNYILYPIVEALGKVGNLAQVVLDKIFKGIAGIGVSAGQFLTGLFYPILKLAGKVNVNQFFSALIYPIMRALEGSFSGVSDLFQKLVIDPIMNAIGMNNLPDMMNIANKAVEAVKSVIGVDITGIFGWDINTVFADIETKLKKYFTVDLTKVFSGWDLGKFLEDAMDELNDLFSIDVPSGHIKLLPNPFKGQFGGPSHFIDFKFQEGGMAHGPSHDQGGIPAVVAPRSSNAKMIEFEGGEFIIKKSTVDKLGQGLLNAINENPGLFMGGEHFYANALPDARPYGFPAETSKDARSAASYPISGGYKYRHGGETPDVHPEGLFSPNGYPSKVGKDLGKIGNKTITQKGGDFFGSAMPGFPITMIDLEEKTGGTLQKLLTAAGLGGPYGFDIEWVADSIQDHSGKFKIGHMQEGGVVHKQNAIKGGVRGEEAFGTAMDRLRGSLPMGSLSGRLDLVNGTMPAPFWGCRNEYKGMHCPLGDYGPCYEVWEITCYGAKGGAAISYDILKPSIGLDWYYDKHEDGGLVTPQMGGLPKFNSGGLVAGGGFKSRCHANGCGGSGGSYGSAVGYRSGGSVKRYQTGGSVIRYENGGYNPLTYQNLDSEGIKYTDSQITNESIGLFDPILFEGFEGLENYETGFQDVGNQLVDQFKLAYIQTAETNRLLKELIAALYSEIGRLENTIITYLETLPTVVQTMDTNLQDVINKMNREVKEEIRLMGEGIEEEVRKIAPSFGELIIEIQAAFVQAILDAGLDKIFEESLLSLEETIPVVVKEGVESSFDLLLNGNDSVEEQTFRALNRIFASDGDGIKVKAEIMSDRWYAQEEALNQNQTNSMFQALAVAALGAAIAAWLGFSAVTTAVLGLALAFRDEIYEAYKGSDLETALSNFQKWLGETFTIDEAEFKESIGDFWQAFWYEGLGAAGQAFKEFLAEGGMTKIFEKAFEGFPNVFQLDWGAAVLNVGVMAEKFISHLVENVIAPIFDINNWNLDIDIDFDITKSDIGSGAITKFFEKVFEGFPNIIGAFANIDWQAELGLREEDIKEYARHLVEGVLGPLFSPGMWIPAITKALESAFEGVPQQSQEQIAAIAFNIFMLVMTGWYWAFVLAAAEFLKHNPYKGSDIDKIGQMMETAVKEFIIGFGRAIQALFGPMFTIDNWTGGHDYGAIFEQWMQRGFSATMQGIGDHIRHFFGFEGGRGDLWNYISGGEDNISREETILRFILVVAAAFAIFAGFVMSWPMMLVGAVVLGLAWLLLEGTEEAKEHTEREVSKIFNTIMDIIGLPFVLLTTLWEGLFDLVGLGDMDIGFDVDILGARSSTGDFDANGGLRLHFLPGLLRGDFEAAKTSGFWAKAPGETSMVKKATKEKSLRGSMDKVALKETGGLLVGPSHADGGISAMVGKQSLIEMEGGEYIIRKSVVDALGPDFFDGINFGGKFIPGGMAKMDEPGEGGFRAGWETSGLLRRAVGHHGAILEALLEPYPPTPKGGAHLFSGGGYVHLLPPGGPWSFDVGFAEGRWETGLNVDPWKLDASIEDRSYARSKVSADPRDWFNMQEGGFIDPELRNLMGELIQVVKDKEMGVNIFNDTGQNMQLEGGDGEGFDESSYREGASLA